MKKYRICINRKKLRTIPRKSYIFPIMLLVLSIALLTSLLPAGRLDEFERIELNIERIRIKPPISTHGSYTVHISDGKESYYLTYHRYGQYRDLVEQDLLSGEVTTSTALLGRQSIWDAAMGRKQILDLRSEDRIYLNFTLERQAFLYEQAGGWCFCLILFMVAVIYIIGIISFNRVIKFKKHASPHAHQSEHTDGVTK